MADGGFRAVPIKNKKAYDKLNRWGVFNASYHDNFLGLGVDILATSQADGRNLGDEEGNLSDLRTICKLGMEYGEPYKDLHPMVAYDKMGFMHDDVKYALSGLPEDIKLYQFLYELNEACNWSEECYHELWT